MESHASRSARPLRRAGGLTQAGDIRACFENDLLTEDETRTALAMVDHRNLTSHTYNEALADEIFAALPAYRQVMRAWLERLAA